MEERGTNDSLLLVVQSMAALFLKKGLLTPDELENLAAMVAGEPAGEQAAEILRQLVTAVRPPIEAE
jgi:hypothetical protein